MSEQNPAPGPPEPPSRGPDLPARIGRLMWVGAWIAAMAILVLAASRFLDHETNPNRRPVLVQGADGRDQVVLAGNRAGHYVADGSINGEPVTFLVDTGASDVAVPLAVARRLGLPQGPPRISRTAAGDVTTFATRLAVVELGGLAVRDVGASILPDMPGEHVLLGMSWLAHFELVQRGGSLTVRMPNTGSSSVFAR